MAKQKTRKAAAKKKVATKESPTRTARGTHPTAGSSTAKQTTTPSSAKRTPAKRATPSKAGTQVELKITHDQIARRAYEIWLARGRPLGQEQQNWYEAEAELIQRKSR